MSRIKHFAKIGSIIMIVGLFFVMTPGKSAMAYGDYGRHHQSGYRYNNFYNSGSYAGNWWAPLGYEFDRNCPHDVGWYNQYCIGNGWNQSYNQCCIAASPLLYGGYSGIGYNNYDYDNY